MYRFAIIIQALIILSAALAIAIGLLIYVGVFTPDTAPWLDTFQ